MAEIIQNRSEILFIYDVTDANPNGDPADENRPRIDEEAGVNIVTDVRLKRTIRDYLYELKNQEIFIREERDEEKNLKRKEDIYEKYGSPDKVIEKCTDIRLFGGTFALKKKGGKKRGKSTDEEPQDEEPIDRAFALTGPVQFKFGRSLHRVGEPTFIKGTTVMPSKEKKGAGTFTEAYILPYSLICFYGIVNENAAKHTRLTDEDVELLLEGIWYGTKNLISRSKFGQIPRLLLQVVSRNKNFYFGELDHRIKLINKQKNGQRIRDEEIRNITEVELDVTHLFETLHKNKDKIYKIRGAKDEHLNLMKHGKLIEINELVPDITFEPLSF